MVGIEFGQAGKALFLSPFFLCQSGIKTSARRPTSLPANGWEIALRRRGGTISVTNGHVGQGPYQGHSASVWFLLPGESVLS